MITGQIGLRRHGAGLVAKAIEWDTYSHTHHTVTAISETQCVSAEPGRGVIVRELSDYPSMDWSRFDLTADQTARVLAAANAAVGLPYNFAIFPVLFVFRIFRARVPNPVSDWLSRRPNVDCSQLCDDIYLAAGIDLLTPANVLTTPGDLERYFIAHGWLAATEAVNMPGFLWDPLREGDHRAQT